MNVYPFIEAEKRSGSAGGPGNVARACELLKVSRSAYYAHAGARAAGGTRRQREDADLVERIHHHHTTSKGRYGAPRIHADLTAEGRRHGRKRVARLMREHGILGRHRRRGRRTTIPDPAAGERPDLIGREFGVDPEQVNTRWCGDITYIRTRAGWLYLATVIDLASRRVVGWAVADHLRTDLVEDALRQAVARRHPPHGVIFHSDRGCQYTSTQFAAAAAELGVRLSVGRAGQCWDNAVGESFFATIKTELLEDGLWPTHAAARTAIFEYIEGWYNTRRRHSTLGYLSPTAYEAGAPAASCVA
ncbi:MAG TPA: IS3 family transposase [Jatrophihabitans sp.]